jgi:hypothetical protein
VTRRQVQKLLEWLKKRIETAKSVEATRETAQLTAPAEEIAKPE